MTPDIEIDARDMLCPLPVLRLRKRLAVLAPGQTARLLATDPMAQIDVPHFCADQGHTLLDVTTEDDTLVFLIRKGAARPPAD